LSTRATLEAQAAQASTLAKQQRLSDREAVGAVLGGVSSGTSAANLKAC
jgi:hypothetical protein